jgi:hypothetical protein
MSSNLDCESRDVFFLCPAYGKRAIPCVAHSLFLLISSLGYCLVLEQILYVIEFFERKIQ